MNRYSCQVLILCLSLILACDSEKNFIQNFRQAEMEIVFGRHRARNENIVRNNIPLEVKVWLHSKTFQKTDVSSQVKWQYQDTTLGTIVYNDSLKAYTYFYQGRKTGFQRITAHFQNYLASREFEVTPVEIVPIPGGEFQMGSETTDETAEKPVHPVLVNDFRMGKYEVTNLEYLGFLNAMLEVDSVAYEIEQRNGFYQTFGNGRLILETEKSFIKFANYVAFIQDTLFNDLPVTGVTWDGALMFAHYYGLELPTEAEWEYACKAQTENEYPGGDPTNLAEYAWYLGSCVNCLNPQPVGLLMPNQFSLYDLHGNVYEWCFDIYDKNFYSQGDSLTYDNPSGPQDFREIIFERVIRGGSFESLDIECRSTYRGKQFQNKGEISVGFRVVRATR